MKRVELNNDKEMLVCDCHAYLLGQYKWRYFKCKSGGYAARSHWLPGRKMSTILFHRLVANASTGDEVDHIDRDKLNNQCSNLRLVTRRQNALNRGMNNNNTSGYKNITWYKRGGLWQVQTHKNHKINYLGRYKTLEEAIKVAEQNIVGWKEFGREKTTV